MIEHTRDGCAYERYLDSGWPGDNYEVTRSADAAGSRADSQGRDLHRLAFPRAVHDERAWAMRAHIPFQLFFGSARRAASRD